jgi:putative tricarboxylic transport membrane protein
MQTKSPKDFWAGLMFIGIGLFFIVSARSYELGSAARMGPAYFPTMLGGLTAAAGLAVLVQSLVRRGEKVAALPFRLMLLITVALLLFAYLLKLIGLVLALAILVVLSSFAGHQFRLAEALVLAGGLIALSVLVFVKGLGQPFPLWPGLFY